MPTKPKILTLALKGEYFDQIKAGSKTLEFRLVNEYWKKRLANQTFDKIVITRGYPKSSDLSKRLEFHWKGFEVVTLTHPHFGSDPVEVFAIHLTNPIH